MAEITEPLLPPNETRETSKPLEPADDINPRTMGRIILGIPLTYKSVEIPLISKTNSFVSQLYDNGEDTKHISVIWAGGQKTSKSNPALVIQARFLRPWGVDQVIGKGSIGRRNTSSSS